MSFEFEGTKEKWEFSIYHEKGLDSPIEEIAVHSWGNYENGVRKGVCIYSVKPKDGESIPKLIAKGKLIACAPELAQNVQMHIDSLDLSDIEFYEKYGFNVSELMDKSRELIKKATQIY